MTDLEIIQDMFDRHLLKENETVVLAEGFEEAFVGITASEPKRAIYDYWKCIDLLVECDGADASTFDDALEWLEDYVETTMQVEIKDQSPLFVKKL
jgi:hypothetical protein|tara:strand:+ start:250 stop:537 length:288 start_codon:yes stop_codon:yes gene_type:complete